MVLVSSDKIAETTARGWSGTQTLWDLFCLLLIDLRIGRDDILV